MINYDDFVDLLKRNNEDFMDLLQCTAAAATQTPPPCTEILPEEAIRYIDAIRKAAYEQGYNEGYEQGYNEGNERGVEEFKAEVRKRVGL
jgi:flagellar biosynthesis/type III secretory pathway protein FliH